MEPLTPHTDASKGFYQCGECHRSYSRIDHLARHVRSHMQEKPFECTVCNKGFGRPHASCHETHRDQKRQKRQVGLSSRVAQACKACANAKLKCEDEKPCKRCQQKKIVCENVESRTGNNQPASRQPSQVIQSNTGSTGHSCFITLGNEQIPTPEPTAMQDGHTPRTVREDLVVVRPLDIDENYFSDFLRDILMPGNIEPFPNSDSNGWTSNQEFGARDVLDFAVEGNLDFNSEDFTMLDEFNGKPMPGLDFEPIMERELNELPGPESTDARKRMALGTEAFQRSPLSRWLPAEQDNAFAEQHNLSICTNDAESPDKKLKLDRRTLSASLDQAARDQILAMVLEFCGPTNVSQAVTAFPTVELLDDLMQSFFNQHCSQVDSWIHLASFSPNSQRPELLAAMVATGAVYTGIKALQKLGFAIRESVRLAIPKRCDMANSITRDLSILQALMLELEVGLWSGNRRKMEIAESHNQVLLTMLRRAGKFQRSRTVSVRPLPEDTGEVLHAKWLEWVEQESYKRLVFHAMLHDAHASMSLLMNPLVSYAELSLSLPEQRELWAAENAEKWKALYVASLKGIPDRLPSPVECIQDSTVLPSVQEFCDLQFSSLIILHGFWGMIWEYIQMNSIMKARAEKNTGSLIMTSRHKDLLQNLQHFRMSMEEWKCKPSSEAVLILELLFLYLHMSLEDIQLFAGKEEKDEARRVFPSLVQWIGSECSRQAVWHAGQVLRVAKAFPPSHLRDFYGIAVYHASLAFWAFGVISQANSIRNHSAGPTVEMNSPIAQEVRLDGNETADVQRFIAFGRGHANIGDTDTPKIATLSDPEAVMNIMLETLTTNFMRDMQEEALPSLIENLVQLMRDLGKAAGAVQR
ncbi:fungal-specific transcription factor domain-containing protein [Cenococcum geophilum]